MLAWLFVCALPLLYATAKPEWVYTLMTPVSLYSMACVYGSAYRENQGYPRRKKHLLWGIIIIVSSFGARFTARMLIDGTNWYDRVIVPYTHMIAAAAIWVIFEPCLRNGKYLKRCSVSAISALTSIYGTICL